MNEVIRIRCPRCSSVLKAKSQEGNDEKVVNCPICNKKSLFKEFLVVTEPPTRNTTASTEEHTVIERTRNELIGMLSLQGTAYRFSLRKGENVVGRKSPTSDADIQLPCTSRRLSRKQVVIKVEEVASKGWMHYISLYKREVNATYVGSEALQVDDAVVLKDGDVIKLPDCELQFHIKRTQP